MRQIRIVGVAVAALLCAARVAVAQDAEAMQYADTNSDGKVTAEEYAAFLGTAWNYFIQGADKAKVAELDPAAKGLVSGVAPDADGVLTKEAFLAAAPAKFKAADKNGDGVLDATELSDSMSGK